MVIYDLSIVSLNAVQDLEEKLFAKFGDENGTIGAHELHTLLRVFEDDSEEAATLRERVTE